MVFSSAIFLFLFLPVVLLLYFLAPVKLRNTLLLLASILFYGWGELGFVPLMLLAIVMNYGYGIVLEQRREQGGSQYKWVLAAVVCNLGLLGYYKYAGFLVDNINHVLVWSGIVPFVFTPPALPLGISFFIFHCLSYLIDIVRAVAPAQRNIINFGLYIAFFPQLIAGPIIRYHDVAAQLVKRYVDSEIFASGIERFIVGLAKKLLLANTLGQIVDQIFVIPGNELSTSVAWFGVLCYGLQIYLDFSAYSDMAIGLARMFGFQFLENFNYPYVATSIQDFWRRWHISLSNWFRDYLYIPLGGNRGSSGMVYRNLFIVFLLCGLWHGASWNFVIWGLLHGGLLVIERVGWAARLARLPKVLQHVYVLMCVAITWVFFRAETLPQAMHYLNAMLGFGVTSEVYYVELYLDREVILVLIVALLASSGLLAAITRDWRLRKAQVRGEYQVADAVAVVQESVWLPWLRVGTLMVLFVLAASQLAIGTYNPFIYFRF